MGVPSGAKAEVKQNASNTHGDMPQGKSGGEAIDLWPARKKQVHNNCQLLSRVTGKGVIKMVE